MKACPGCERTIADVMGQCPFCRHTFPVVEGAKPTIDPALIAAALAAEARPPVRTSLLQAALLALALPVLVPALLLAWITAKRWGRVDWLWLGFIGCALTAMSFQSTLLLTLMLVADVAAAALFVARYEKLEFGICLGYSNTVSMLLILGGLLSGGALVFGLPFGALLSTLNLLALEMPVTAAELARDRLPPAPAPVRIEAPQVGDEGIHERTPSGFELRGGAGLEIADPAELWRRREQLAGRLVRLANPAAALHSFAPQQLEREVTPGVKEKAPVARAVGVLDATEGRVWITADSEASLKEPAPRAGVLRVAYTNATLGRAWTPLGMKFHLPYQVVLIEPLSGPPPDPSAEAYVPVQGAEGRGWLRFPSGFPGELPRVVRGVLEPTWPMTPFVEKRPPLTRVITVESRTGYLARSQLGRDLRAGVTPGGLLALALGACLMAGGVLCSIRE